MRRLFITALGSAVLVLAVVACDDETGELPPEFWDGTFDSPVARPEHPRPDLWRDTFVNLNTVWQFAFDPGDVGLDEGWVDRDDVWDREIQVPYAWEAPLSGLGEIPENYSPMYTAMATTHRGVAWYRLQLPGHLPEGADWHLVFGAVDFEATVWVDGTEVGTHTNTAFALAHALDYARALGNADLEQRLVARSREYYLDDRECPAAYEPSGTDFLSPCLEEADLMRRVLRPDEFEPWLEAFLPDPTGPGMASLREPAVVLDLSDPYLVHLVGLNLSRAWCMAGVASQLPEGHPTRAVFQAAAGDHADAGMGGVFTDEYGGEHWLATYAVYLLGGTGLPGGG